MFDFIFQLYALFQFKGFLKEVILVLFIATLLLLVVMFVQKLITERNEHRISQVKHYYLSACYLYLNDPSFSVRAPNTHLETMALADVIIYLLAETDKKKHSCLQNLANNLRVAEKLCRQATAGGSWVSRLLAVEKLGFLKLPATAPLYRELLAREREPHLIAKLLWALSQIATMQDVATINRVLLSHPVISGKFNELLYCNIITSFTGRKEAAVLLPLIEGLLAGQELSLQLKRDLVEACGAARLAESRSLLIKAYNLYNGEIIMKIACLRAIGVLGGDIEGRLTHPALSDPDWRVRAVAARYAVLSAKEILPALKALLGDSSYHVRINAARSLGATSEEGRAILYQQLNSNDRFVRDVCAYVLEGV